MPEQKTYTEEELQKIIVATQQKDFFLAYGRQWFIESLAHTANLVNQGAFPQEAHQIGQVVFQQFMANAGAPSPAQVAKKEEESAPDE